MAKPWMDPRCTLSFELTTYKGIRCSLGFECTRRKAGTTSGRVVSLASLLSHQRHCAACNASVCSKACWVKVQSSRQSPNRSGHCNRQLLVAPLYTRDQLLEAHDASSSPGRLSKQQLGDQEPPSKKQRNSRLQVKQQTTLAEQQQQKEPQQAGPSAGPHTSHQMQTHTAEAFAGVPVSGVQATNSNTSSFKRRLRRQRRQRHRQQQEAQAVQQLQHHHQQQQQHVNMGSVAPQADNKQQHDQQQLLQQQQGQQQQQQGQQQQQQQGQHHKQGKKRQREQQKPQVQQNGCDQQQPPHQQRGEQQAVAPPDHPGEVLQGGQQQQQQQQQQQHPLLGQQKPRVYAAARAVAAYLDANIKQQLLQRLDYIADHVRQIPKHLSGCLQYCSICNEDLEDALLLYKLADGDFVCRSCFVVAFAAWQHQQLMQQQQQQDWAASITSSSSSSADRSELPDLPWCGLSERQQQAVMQWSRAAAALRNMTAGPLLPSPQHTALLSDTSLLSGEDWPEEYCAVRQGKASLRHLKQLLVGLEDFTVQPYSALWDKVQPAKARKRTLDSKGAVSISVAGVMALLDRLQLSNNKGAEQDTAAPADLATQVLAALTGRSNSSGSGKAGTRKGITTTSSSSSQAEPPYFAWSLIDRDAEVGVAAADAEINELLGSTWDTLPPSSSTAQARRVARKYRRKLRAAAKAAKASGRAGDSEACRLLSAALRIRFSRAAGELVLLDLGTQGLLLLGRAGTGTRAHIDLAAALTYAFAVMMDGQPVQPHAVLARWLFISPEVFVRLPLLRKLLWLLQRLYRQRAVDSCQQQLAELEQAAAARPRRGRAAAAVSEEAARAEAALQQAQEEMADLVQQQQAAAVVDPAGSSALSAQEQAWLTDMLTDSRLSPAEMQVVAVELGAPYAVLIDQRAGEGVSVAVGWMHWVSNLLPCIKVAWELVRPEQMAMAVQTQRALRCRAQLLPPDYLTIVPGAVNELLLWRRFVACAD